MKQPKPYATCGAKNRQGEPCQRPPLKGKTRCKLHGGASKKGTADNKRNTRHGLYTQSLTEAEYALWSSIEIGNVDNEIRMAKVMLNRALALAAEIRQAPNSAQNLAGFELSEITQSVKGGKKDSSMTSKRPDTFAQIDRLMGRIAGLEKTRAELIAAAADKPSMDLKFVVEIPPENPAAEWLATYSNPPPPTPSDAEDPGNDEDAD